MIPFYFIVACIALLTIVYVLLIASFCYGWINTKCNVPTTAVAVKISVIISARNEEENIGACLEHIINQTYSNQFYEIIVVDDASTDLTNKIVKQYCDKNSFIKQLILNETTIYSGKKRAIEMAIAIATGELIVTVDADCIMPENWLTTIAAFYKKTNSQMIVGPVCFYEENNVFEKMQSLEFMALIASGGSALYYNKAIMCNGANLAYTKKAFLAVNGFKGVENSASGDDVLLMYKINNKFPKSIRFLKHNQAIVYTKPKTTLTEFINQRKRWASKGYLSLNSETKAVSLIVYLFNILLIALPFFDFIKPIKKHFPISFFEITLLLLLIKCVIDFLLLFLVTSFFKKKQFLIYFIPEQLIYLFYIVLIGVLGATGTYEWKGRKVKK